MGVTRRQILQVSGLSMIVGLASLAGYNFGRQSQRGRGGADAAVLDEFRQGNVVVREGIVVAPSESNSTLAYYQAYFATKAD